MTDIEIDDNVLTEALDLIADDFGPQDLARIIQQRDNATRELEGIAAFDGGQAGDAACRFLMEAGVWSRRVQRMDGTPIAFAPHVPHRGSDVETYIKAERDRYGSNPHDPSSLDFVRHRALDRLLDDYRLHADTGTPLDQEALDGGDPENSGAHL